MNGGAMKKPIWFGVLWLFSLLLVATAALAQRVARPNASEPEVIAGPDVGFRVDSYNGETPVGELVVRRNGKWVAVQFGAGVKRTR
jgi:hypothetical protein